MYILIRDLKKSYSFKKLWEDSSGAQQGYMCTFWRGNLKFFLAHSSLPNILFSLKCAWMVSLKQIHMEITRHEDTQSLKLWSFQRIWHTTNWGLWNMVMSQPQPVLGLETVEDLTKLYWATELSLGCTWKPLVFSGGSHSLNRSKFCQPLLLGGRVAASEQGKVT